MAVVWRNQPPCSGVFKPALSIAPIHNIAIALKVIIKSNRPAISKRPQTALSRKQQKPFKFSRLSATWPRHFLGRPASGKNCKNCKNLGRKSGSASQRKAVSGGESEKKRGLPFENLSPFWREVTKKMGRSPGPRSRLKPGAEASSVSFSVGKSAGRQR